MKESEEKYNQLKKAHEEALAEVEKTKKGLANNEKMVELKVLSSKLQIDFNDCVNLTNTLPEEVSVKAKGALKQLLTAMLGKL